MRYPFLRVIMKENKNIDELFKEGFKNFEATPSPDVWNKIEAKLKEDDDRKVIPLWIKLAGIAALLALLFTVGNAVFNSSITNTTNPIVTEDTTEINQQNSEENNNNQNNVVVENASNTRIASEEEKPTVEENKNPSDIITNKKSSTSETRITSENKKQNASNNNNSLIKEPNTNTLIKTGIANGKAPKNGSEENSLLVNKEINPIIIDTEKEAVATETIKSQEDYSEIENTKTTEIAEELENKKSIFDAINETPNEDVVIAKADNKPDNRWEVMPNVGPVYYNSLSEGSSIDPSFSDNPKSGDLNITYGVQLSYNVTNRLSIRTGLSNVNLSYSTTDLELGTGPVAASTSSIDYDTRGNVTIPVDKGSLSNENPDGGFGDISPKSTSGEVVLNQDLSYYEIPLELKYALLNKKFGINIIGGFSTLLLGTNEVSVDAGNFSDVLGEANNLSSLSFTTNLGLGLNYSFSKKLMFNVEPMFKYQLNPYTDSSVDFKPYYIGIYSGLSFKF